MAKVLLGLFAAVFVLPVLATSGHARDVGIGIKSFAQDKITFDRDVSATSLEASSTYNGNGEKIEETNDEQ